MRALRELPEVSEEGHQPDGEGDQTKDAHTPRHPLTPGQDRALLQANVAQRWEDVGEWDGTHYTLKKE